MTATDGGKILISACLLGEAVRYDGFIQGKEELGLFVPLNGSCYFVRKDVLDGVGGWNVDSLSEDMELAARLVHEGHKIRYASDVRSWQEYPSNVSGFFKQRVRWFRGTMEASLKYGKLLRHPSSFVAFSCTSCPMVS